MSDLKCPLFCGEIRETEKAYGCSNWREKGCGFAIWKETLSHTMTEDEVRDLIEKRETEVITDFVSRKTGKPFSAKLVLNAEGKTEFQFPQR